MLGALMMRRKAKLRQRPQKSDRPTASASSDYEGERVGTARRKRRRKDCKHDPWAQDLAQIIIGAYHWIVEPAKLRAKLGNGLEDTAWSKLCEQESSILWGMIGFRLFNYLVVQTYFVPDEYWQSLEVAHHQAFGRGYLTWEWTAKIRSYLYPAVFTLIYKLADLMSLDSFATMTRLPRILQAVFYAVGDLYLYKLSTKLAGPLVGQWALLCNCLNWFVFYCATRTLTNTAETALIVIALYYYPWSKATEKFGDSLKFLWLAAVAVMVRPTAAIFWLPLCTCHLWGMRRQLRKALVLYGTTALLFGFMMMRVDKALYGEWTLVPANFFIFNISKKISHIYGTHGFWWYFTQGLPFILSTHLIPVLVGWKACRNRSLQILCVWSAIVYSMLAHKEFRFVLPVMPLLMHVCGYYATVLHQRQAVNDQMESEGDDGGGLTEDQISEQLRVLKAKNAGEVAGHDSGLTTASELSDSFSDSEIIRLVKRRQERSQPAVPLLTPRRLLVLLVVGNLPMMLYLCLLHQRGALDVVQHLHQASVKSGNMSVLFLMPCHSTPYYSHVHSNITMRFLTCEPNLANQTDYTDEAEAFYQSPSRWLKDEAVKGSNGRVYSHVVMFDALESAVSKFLAAGRYRQSAIFFYSHFPGHGRRSKYIKVFERGDN